MLNVNNLQIELKTGLFLGLTALILSFLTGIIAGISMGTVVLRAFISMVLFTGIGYGAVIVLKKFVPEIQKISDGEEIDSDGGDVPNIGGATERDSEDVITPGESGGGEVFSELDTSEIPRVQPGDSSIEPAAGADMPGPVSGGPDSSAGKLGKHIIASEDTFKYEPKLMAEAVRTMMSKDED